MISWRFSDNTSIINIFSIPDVLNTISSVKEPMFQDGYTDICHCMHFIDDCGAYFDIKWSEYFDDVKERVGNSTTPH